MQDISFLNNVNIDGDEIVRGNERVDGNLRVSQNIELSGSILSGGVEISTLWGAGGPVDAPVTSVNYLTGDVLLDAASVNALSLTGGSVNGNLSVVGITTLSTTNINAAFNANSACNVSILNVATVGNFLGSANVQGSATIGNTLTAASVICTTTSGTSAIFATVSGSHFIGDGSLISNANDATKLPLSGGVVTGTTQFNDDVTIFGDLSCTGVQTFANTVFLTTSALSVVHFGVDTAVYIGSDGAGDIASFYDLDQNIEMLHIGGANSTYPNVGIKTSQPNETFTVNGNTSAHVVYASGGNSLQWNTTHATVLANSATWSTAYTIASASYDIASNSLSLTGGSVVGNVSATAFYGDGSNLTGVGSALSVDVQTFTAIGIWNKPANAKFVSIVALGGGGSGQGGGMWDGATAVAAAVGGGGGGFNELMLPANNLPSSLIVRVGEGGASAAGRASAGLATNGNAGLATVLSAAGVVYVQAGGGGGGIASAGNAGVYNGNVGATAGVAAGSSMRGGPGGGSGGGLGVGGSVTAGRPGGEGMAGACQGGAAGAGQNFSNGSNGDAGSVIPGMIGLSVSSGGGGGGATSWASGVGGAGGAGGGYGSGGGGGGAGKAGGGESGAGANGFAIITTFF